MNRDAKRETGRRQRAEEAAADAGEVRSLTGSQRRERTGPRKFLREVRAELRRVAWPSWREVRSYSLVVLVTVTLLTIYVALLDAAFGRAMFEIFG
jgi:preprotein translocase subunit SecE